MSKFSIEKPNPPLEAQLKAAGATASLKFPGWQGVDLTATLTSLNPPSSPNKPWCIVTELLSGVAPHARFLGADTSVKFFQLKKLALACAVLQGIIAVDCKVKATGETIKGKIVEQIFEYKTTGPFGNTFKQVTFNQPDFSEVKSVTWSILGDPAGVSLLIDDIFLNACLA